MFLSSLLLAGAAVTGSFTGPQSCFTCRARNLKDCQEYGVELNCRAPKNNEMQRQVLRYHTQVTSLVDAQHKCAISGGRVLDVSFDEQKKIDFGKLVTNYSALVIDRGSTTGCSLVNSDGTWIDAPNCSAVSYGFGCEADHTSSPIFNTGHVACQVEIRHWYNPVFRMWQQNGVRMGCKQRGACRRQKANNYKVYGRKTAVPKECRPAERPYGWRPKRSKSGKIVTSSVCRQCCESNVNCHNSFGPPGNITDFTKWNTISEWRQRLI